MLNNIHIVHNNSYTIIVYYGIIICFYFNNKNMSELAIYKNEVLLSDLLTHEYNNKQKNREEIFRKERQAYYEQNATNNLKIIYTIMRICYWTSYAIIVSLFIFKKLISFHKKNLGNFLILGFFAIYPFIMGTIYELVIKFIKYLWNILPKDVYQSF